VIAGLTRYTIRATLARAVLEATPPCRPREVVGGHGEGLRQSLEVLRKDVAAWWQDLLMQFQAVIYGPLARGGQAAVQENHRVGAGGGAAYAAGTRRGILSTPADRARAEERGVDHMKPQMESRGGRNCTHVGRRKQ